MWDEFGYEDKERSRVVYLLFHEGGGEERVRTEAVEAMKALAVVVRRCEDAEIVASKTTPDAMAAAAVADAVRTTDERAAEREAKHTAALVKATSRVGGVGGGDTTIVPPWLPPWRTFRASKTPSWAPRSSTCAFTKRT